ncbi:preprotein translocase subunit SecE [uncultured Selenomonas sp.]|jgi:preprotein translocase, secE subunit|uniref:preprotein translocase subunit SecE n=1 Tax=uncultured Selenomonas sp. TaxID=159275 RepID=UPI00056A6170|nr:preprotein translocase subunit SecE [uncultured Selenomonas sp.]
MIRGVNALADERSSAPQSSSGGFNLFRFLGEVKAEMKKVTWPTHRELVTYTGVVGVAVVVVCALIWVCDTFFARLFKLILQ